jgi:hypothetical protein
VSFTTAAIVCTPVNVAACPAIVRGYYEIVTRAVLGRRPRNAAPQTSVSWTAPRAAPGLVDPVAKADDSRLVAELCDASSEFVESHRPSDSSRRVGRNARVRHPHLRPTTEVLKLDADFSNLQISRSGSGF